MPETISTKHIYKGRIFDIRVDTVREGELEYERDIIAHPGSGVIVPVYEDGTVALVRQHRPLVRSTKANRPKPVPAANSKRKSA
jgi:hypothetical protein